VSLLDYFKRLRRTLLSGQSMADMPSGSLSLRQFAFILQVSTLRQSQGLETTRKVNQFQTAIGSDEGLLELERLFRQLFAKRQSILVPSKAVALAPFTALPFQRLRDPGRAP
jgi:hypothetical protein